MKPAAAAPALLALLLTVSSLSARERKTDDAVFDALDAVKTFNQVVISPDGKHVAWSVKGDGAWTCPVTGGEPVRVAKGEIHGLSYSPNGHALAFLKGKTNRQLYVRRGTEAPLPLTKMTGFLAAPAWSPDGRSIAFLLIENARREAGATVAMTRETGVIAEHIDEQRIAVVDVGTKAVRIVSPANMYVYHFDWAPDSKRIVAEAAPGSGDNNYWIAQLHAVDVAAASMSPLYQPKLQLASPRWSPDGKHIAFLEGLMSDEGSDGGDIMVMNADGTEVRNVTAPLKISPASIRWSENGDLIYMANVQGDAAIAHITAAGAQHPATAAADGEPALDWRASESLTSGEDGAWLSRDGKSVAFIGSSFAHAPEVLAGPVGHWKRLTAVNASTKQMTGQTKSIRWKSDEYDVQGWLMFPVGFLPGRKYPMVTIIHGGPSSVAAARWPSDQNILLSGHGFFVFLPNPRGSYGQGERFTQANVKDFGYGDLRDVMRGIDAVEAAYPVDDSRLGIGGWSYGGFMTMWTVTQTQRFKAAVAGAGVANWQSYYGENDITQWMIPFFGASVYEDPAVYARSSPITFIKNVKTPTLIEVGERDGECPAPQSYEFWRALKTFGVETQLVVYPDEGHHFAKRENKRDSSRRLVRWFVDRLGDDQEQAGSR